MNKTVTLGEEEGVFPSRYLIKGMDGIERNGMGNMVSAKYVFHPPSVQKVY